MAIIRGSKRDGLQRSCGRDIFLPLQPALSSDDLKFLQRLFLIHLENRSSEVVIFIAE